MVEPVLKMWKDFGPFNLRKTIDEGNVAIKGAHNFVADLKIDACQFTGHRSEADNSYVGRLWCKSFIFEGAFVYDEVKFPAPRLQFGKNALEAVVCDGFFKFNEQNGAPYLHGRARMMHPDGTNQEGMWELGRFLG